MFDTLMGSIRDAVVKKSPPFALHVRTYKERYPSAHKEGLLKKAGAARTGTLPCTPAGEIRLSDDKFTFRLAHHIGMHVRKHATPLTIQHGEYDNVLKIGALIYA